MKRDRAAECPDRGLVQYREVIEQSAIERLKRARNVEELAEQIEPLAQALAALADETRQTLADRQQASRAQARHGSSGGAAQHCTAQHRASRTRRRACGHSRRRNAGNERADRWLLAGAVLIGSAASYERILALAETTHRQNMLDVQAVAST
jgi:hypothetical protein